MCIRDRYKAAFYKGGGLDSGYWTYATQSDELPAKELPSGNPNAANYDEVNETTRAGALISVPVDVGSYYNAVGPYGTFDQAGNVYEWNEEVRGDDSRALMGGSFFIAITGGVELAKFHVAGLPPDSETRVSGFRLASSVPEPGVGLFSIILCVFSWIWLHRYCQGF